jgi:hypothetical protein
VHGHGHGHGKTRQHTVIVIPLPRAFGGAPTGSEDALLVLASTSPARRLAVTAQFALGLPVATRNAGLVGSLEVSLGGAGVRFLHYAEAQAPRSSLLSALASWMWQDIAQRAAGGEETLISPHG